jgi:diguanylate cyclase
MGNHDGEHERTIAFADIALRQIRALRQPATPRHFEIWYTYATGYNRSLNEMINETLTRNGTLSEADIDQIYDTCFSANRFTDRIDRVGTKVKVEIEQVMTMIGDAAGNASHYTEDLASASQQLGAGGDAAGVRSIVEGLVEATRNMQMNNELLEARLNASKKEVTELQEHLEAVRTESLTDPLTSLANRKYFNDAIENAIARAHAEGQPLALMLTDIDHFKRFNDSYGHLTGDQVLRLVAMSVKQHVKGQDTAARYGGEEFAIVLPNTALPDAVALADHIRRTVMNKDLMKRSTGEHLGRITISVGVAALQAGDTPARLIERADGHLYVAKRGGRNRVVSETELDFPATVTEVA